MNLAGDTLGLLFSIVIGVFAAIEYLPGWIRENAVQILPVLLILVPILLIVCCILLVVIHNKNKAQKYKGNIGEKCVR